MTMQAQLNQYYKDVGIAPVVPKDVGITPVDSMEDIQKKMFCEFPCEKRADCREACLGAWNKKEEFVFEPRIDGVTVSQEYQAGKYHGDRIPRIVVLSLSAPQPSPGQILSIPQPKEEQDKPAANSKTRWRASHWPETLAMVRSFLLSFIACENFPGPATYQEAKSKKEIEKLFVHVRTAKCCSNAKGTSQEPGKVYENCGGYLGKELSILKPDVIVTQGNQAHWRAVEHAFEENANISVEEVRGIETKNCIACIVNLKEGNQRVYWLPLYHPRAVRYYYPQAGDKIDCESNVGSWSAMRKNLVRYGEAIKDFINDR